MNASERSHQGLLEAVLTSFAPCEEIVKFRHNITCYKYKKTKQYKEKKNSHFGMQSILINISF